MSYSDSICFVSLFDGDFGSSINSWIDIFDHGDSFPIFRKIVDYGLGVIYNHAQWRISPQLQSQMVNILPSKSKFKIKRKSSSKSIQFVEIRHQIYQLSPQSLKHYFNNLSSIMSNEIISAAIKFGFEKHKHQLSSHMLSHLISNRNTQQTLIYGYCRLFAKLTRHKLIPIDIIQLCYYHYFILYIAVHSNEIESRFGNEYGINSLNYKHIDWNNINHHICDSWNIYLSHPLMKIHSNCFIQRIQHQTKELAVYNVFCNETVQLGQTKKWKIKITPYIGNLTIGICDTTECVASNVFSHHNLEFSELYYGFGLYVVEGRIERLGKALKNVDDAHSVSCWKEEEYLITMELDMTINNDKENCTLKCTVNDYDWGTVLDEEIDTTRCYRLAISCFEKQKIELINDCCNQHKDTEGNEGIMADNILETTCRSIGKYYELMGKSHIYYPQNIANNKGLFFIWFEEEEMDIDDIENDFSDLDECCYLEFDENFPFPDNIINHKEEMQFEIMRYCFKNHKSPTLDQINQFYQNIMIQKQINNNIIENIDLNIIELDDSVSSNPQIVDDEYKKSLSVYHSPSLLLVNKDKEIAFWCEYLYDAYSIFGETIKPFHLFLIGINIKLLCELTQSLFSTSFPLKPKFLARIAWEIVSRISLEKIKKQASFTVFDYIVKSNAFLTLQTLKYNIADNVCNAWNEYISNPKMKSMIDWPLNNKYTPCVSNQFPLNYSKYGRSPLCGYLLHIDQNSTKQSKKEQAIECNSCIAEIARPRNEYKISSNFQQIIPSEVEFEMNANSYQYGFRFFYRDYIKLPILIKETNDLLKHLRQSCLKTTKNIGDNRNKQKDILYLLKPSWLKREIMNGQQYMYLSPNDYRWKLKNQQKRSTFKKSHKVRNKQYFKTDYTRRRW